MMRISDKDLGNPADKVLYHAVSSYQLLEVMLHRLTYHPKKWAVLVLPDFIIKKYPQVQKLKSEHFFDDVILFPYLQIPHVSEKQVLRDVMTCYEQAVPYDIETFSEIYLAGAHFYFSLFLIQEQIPFSFFEDAAGMLSRWEELYGAMSQKYPLHAEIARKYGLYDGSNPFVRRVICLKKAQAQQSSDSKHVNFSVEDTLQALPARERKNVLRFFLKHTLRGKADAILLTQHFANLGIMSETEQRQLYERLRDGILSGLTLMIKPHPDDTLDYRKIFPKASVIREIFPSELLPYVFHKKPDVIYTWNSTGCENLRKHFVIREIGRGNNAR